MDLRDHYIERITKRNRFTKIALDATVEGTDENISTKEHIQREGNRSTTTGAYQFLRNVRKIEQENSKILALSTNLKLA